MKPILLFSFLTFLVACGTDQNSTGTAVQNKNDSLAAGLQNGPVTTDDGLPVAKEIGRKRLHPGRVELKGDFAGDSALKAIFPGKYTEVEGNDEFYHVVWWTCGQCERVPLFYNYFIEPEPQGTFPDSAFNTTLVLGQQKLQLQNGSYELLIFFHTEQFAPDFTGRFIGAPTGAALFKKENNRYVMENFAPVLGCFGSFSTPVQPDIIHVGQNNFLLDFTYGNGGPGSEYTGVKELFMTDGNGFKRVLTDRFLFCSNTAMGEWSAAIHALDSVSNHGLYDLAIVTTGWVDGSGLNETEDEDDLHYFNTASDALKAKVKEAMEKKEKFNFSLVRIFSYNGKEYTCTKSTTDFTVKTE